MDIAQLLEYILDTMYGDGDRPEIGRTKGLEGYRFFAEGAYSDGTPCTMDVCLIAGRDALYYMQVEGGVSQGDRIEELTDTLLDSLSLK